MSAPALNAAPPPSTGPAQGIGAGAPAAQGPLAGFEALLAAFFGAQGEPLVPGPMGKTTTLKPGAAAGAPVTEGADSAGDPTTAATGGDSKAIDAAAAAQAACNAATLVLPTAALPLANTSVETAAGDAAAGEDVLAKAAAHFNGLAKTATPTPPSVMGEPIGAEAGAAGTPGVQPDPKAQAPSAAALATTTKLDPAVATKPDAPQPTRLAAPQPSAPPQPTPPVPAPPSVASPPPEVLQSAPVTAVAAALAAPQAAVEANATQQAAPVAPTPSKDKAQGAKPGRNEQGRVDIAAPSVAKSGLTATPAADSPPNTTADDLFSVQAAGADSKTEAADAPRGSADAGAATASTTNASTLVHPGAIPVRGSPQTVANLAAQIAKKLEGRSTRFDLQLDPAGLGRVDVRMEIGATGRMTAAMTFDTPQAAAELRSRAAELQRHLEQAGFDMSGGLSFDVAGDRGQGRQAQQNHDSDAGQAFRGRAFQQALATAGEAAQSAASGALNLRRSLLSGVDIRI